MAPQTEKPSTVDKCHNETVETKNKFSFRWLLRRSKSSKSAKELTQAGKYQSTTVPTSKSCDSGVTGFSNMDKCSAFLLWRLFPSRGKNPVHCDKSDQVSIASGHSFKTSFSSGDVYGMLSAAKSPFTTTKSSHNILASAEFQQDSRLPHPNRSSASLNRQNCGVDHSHATGVQEGGQMSQKEEMLSTVYHLVLCKLCLSMVPVIDMYCLEECECVFCVSCMKQYLTVNIKEGNVVITCPDADCQAEGNVQLAEIQELVGDEVFDMFQRFQLNREVELDPTRTWCPTAGCETICSVRPSANPEKGVPVHCHNCNLTFCSTCKERCHGNKTCEELRKALKEEEEFPVSDEEEASIKRCPNCRIPIERDEGCAQMMCKRCKHVFCWYCLASLDDDFLLRHYDKGPCRNKLGHSRASVVWHRTQVVGIFAGFGFLLLVASPLLLLAAPCLLCCRCKNCKFFYEEPTPL